MSIVAVLGGHCVFVSGFPSALAPAFRWIFDGDLGVRMFFVISGFLISWLMLAEFDRSNRVSLWRFFARRALRILPVYFAFLFALLLLQCFTDFRQSYGTWVGNVTFTTNFSREGNWTSGHLWSLAMEEQFYLIWPCLFVFLGCGKGLRRSLFILSLPLCIAALSRVISYLDVKPLCFGTLFTQHSFFCYFDSLAIGCISAVLAARAPEATRLWTTSRPWTVFFLGSALIVIPHSLMLTFKLGILTVPLGPTCEGVGLALLLLQSLSVPKFGFYPALNLRVPRQVGILSYSIYIWQQAFCTRPSVFGFGSVWWMAFPFWIVSALAMASLSYYGLERPFLKLRGRFRN